MNIGKRRAVSWPMKRATAAIVLFASACASTQRHVELHAPEPVVPSRNVQNPRLPPAREMLLPGVTSCPALADGLPGLPKPEPTLLPTLLSRPWCSGPTVYAFYRDGTLWIGNLEDYWKSSPTVGGHCWASSADHLFIGDTSTRFWQGWPLPDLGPDQMAIGGYLYWRCPLKPTPNTNPNKRDPIP
jgi:hypothetical protein